MTAHKYGVDPNNIRRRKNNFAKDEATQAADGTNTLLRKTDIRTKTRHKGKLGTMSEEIRKYLWISMRAFVNKAMSLHLL